MAISIKKLKKGGEQFYPQTGSDAILVGLTTETLTTKLQDVDQSITNANQSIAQGATKANALDTKLTQTNANLSAEVQARTLGYNDLQDGLSSEVTRATNAESTLQVTLTQEINARESAIKELSEAEDVKSYNIGSFSTVHDLNTMLMSDNFVQALLKNKKLLNRLVGDIEYSLSPIPFEILIAFNGLDRRYIYINTPITLACLNEQESLSFGGDIGHYKTSWYKDAKITWEKVNKQDIDTVTQTISAEITRATNTENALQGNVDELYEEVLNEGERAKNAELALSTELGKKFDKSNILQELGDSKESIVSQKAVTDAIEARLTDAPTDGQLYGRIDGNWEAFQLEALYCYGVEIDTSVSSPLCTRIGNVSLHKTLPIQNKMRGCLLDDDGNVVQYLSNEDWQNPSLKDGSHGQVMIELPEFYWKFETEGTIRRVKMSEMSLPNYTRVKKQYVSAYEATVDRKTNTLASVLNLTTQFRGGSNNSTWDSTYRTFLGRCATVINRTNFRNYARKRKANSTEWNCYTYNIHKELYWLFVVEYATLNSQAPFNAEKTSEGFMQGGLGNGVSNTSNWDDFNSYYPFVPIGHTDEFGNNSGEKLYTISNDDNSITQNVYVNRYRGIENPFAHIWQWTDGINIRISPTAANGGDDLSKVFVCDDPAKFNDSNYDGYHHVGNEARSEGYVKTAIFGEEGDIMPKTVGGGSTTYHCDYHYTDIPTTETLRGVLFGGNAHYGSYCGFACAYSNSTPSSTLTRFGSRLCFIPND